MRRILYLALATSTLWMSPAQATPSLEEICPKLGKLLDKLEASKWREKPTHAFWSGQSAVIITTSGRNGTWTLITIDKMGEHCIARPVSSGRGYWQALQGQGS